MAGYYDYLYYISVYTTTEMALVTFLRKCDPMENSITEDFFVRAELPSFFLDNHGEKMYEQLM